MAALTVTDGVFGTKGTTCPATLYKMVDYTRTVDFAASPVNDNANYALMPVPKGFIIMDLAVEQLEYVADASKTWSIKLKSDGDTVIGKTFTPVTSGTMIRECNAALAFAGSANTSTGAITVSTAPGGKFCSAADTLCICVPDALTSDKCSKGKFAVHMIGYQAFGESIGDVASGTPAWAEGQTSEQAGKNQSGGDPMFRAPEYRG